MARDQSLVARVLALGGEPSSWTLDTKKQCNADLRGRHPVALAHRAADIGTAVHRMTEMLDRGQPVEAGPWEPDIEAYVNALIEAELSVAEVECRLVCDDLEMAGTADRILRNGSRNLIADIKTGETVDYGGLGWAAQLAVYAHGALYDVDERASGWPPPTSTAPPASSSTCRPVRDAAPSTRSTSSPATAPRNWPTRSAPCAARRSGGSNPSPPPHRRPTSPPAALPVPAGGDRRARLLERYGRLDANRQIAFRARGVDRDDLDAVEAALDALEPVAVADELLHDSASVAELNERLLVITPEQRARLNALARQALEGQGQPIVFRFEPFTRNVHICAGPAVVPGGRLRRRRRSARSSRPSWPTRCRP